MYGLVLERIERDEDYRRSLESKLTSLLSGVVAFIGFSFRVNISPWTAGAALLYIVPLGFLFNAYLMKRGQWASTPASLRRSFPLFPISALRESIDAMLLANAESVAITTRKAGAVDCAIVLTGLVTVIVLITQFVLAAAH